MKDSQANTLSLMLLLNRLSLGLLFALAGVRKLLPKEDGSVAKSWQGFAEYVAGESPLPEFLGRAYGYALPPVEFFAGMAIIIGLYTRLSSTLIALMLLSFIIAMGPEWWLEGGPAYSKNFILLTLALLLAVAGSGRFAIKPDGPLRK